MGDPRVAGACSALLLSVRGRRLSPSDVRRALERRARVAGVSARSPHALRHAYATHLLEGGAGLARNSGAARSRVRRDHPDLRARRRSPSRARARRPPPPRMMAAETTTETTEHVPREELGEIWRQYKTSGDRALARPPDPDLRAARQVRRRQARRVAAAARRGGRPHLLRPARPDRRDRALRARPRDQVRDVRHLPHPRRDDRRAALPGLGSALGAQPRPRDRACDGRAREPPQAHAE